TLLAHIGSFVPAKSAEIAITDRIFTRVGASDDLAFGQSTFMVEMVEMANILHNATDNSLIILDEIGRGTSTFDGLSIAWAVVEYLSKNLKAKVLFATHYHELTELEGILEGVKNFKINVKEINNAIVFLRKIVRGGANRSFGIEVASLAGLPTEIITRAKEISHNIEQCDFDIKLANTQIQNKPENQEKFLKANEVVGILKDININKLSPLDAFEILQDLIKKVK
ncbi:MAG: DNA mismatch repair protein MutS, partial [Clostridia bacterium]|nr:DNA mismatch repair protein MutS [Clostridia bacterium]